MTLAAIDVRPLAGAMGAEIHGVDLTRPLDDATFETIRRAFLDHLAVFLPDQRLSAGDMARFVSRFGEPSVHPFLKPIDPDFPVVHEVRKEPDAAINYGGEWHMDMTFLEKPGYANALYAREIPPVGGDTMFINMCAAYEALSEPMKRILGGLRAVHAVSPYFLKELEGAANRSLRIPEGEMTHPAVRTIPETGRKCIYAYPAATPRFEGMTEAESRPIIEFLGRHAERPEFQLRYRWRRDTLGIWDNRCTMHYALNDYPRHRRVMHRMVVMDSERPS